jgi:hypothetical protein
MIAKLSAFALVGIDFACNHTQPLSGLDGV